MNTIALGSIFTECNHLGGSPTDLACFKRYELRRGNDILTQTTGTVGGMLSILRERQAKIAPLLVATTCPGGPLTAECYRQLKTEMLESLKASGPVDGVLLALHGSAAVADVGDLEGDLLQAVRNQVGPKVPIVGTLDLHAHVTEQMVKNADALLAWETYPHKDAYSTGERGARMLLDIVTGKCRPTMAMAKVPVVVSGVLGHTEGPGPFADVMRFGKSHEGQPGILSVSVFLVHPYIDLPDMGSGGLVITDNDMPRAVAIAEEIARRYWERRFDLDPPVCTPAEGIRRGLARKDKTILLVEAADCCGGGATGDSIATLKALLELAPQSPALFHVVDPEAAALCHQAGVGSQLTLKLGHKLDPRWGQPITVTGKVVKLGNGEFRYTGGIWDGQIGRMGPSAVFQIGEIKIMIVSHATYDWKDEQYRSMDLDPSQAKFVVVKNPMNYRVGYAGVYQNEIILDTPGPTPAIMHHVPFQRIQRPYYPADRDIPGLKPRVWQHEFVARS